MVLHTPRLTLRPATVEDLYTTHAYAGDLENTRMMMFLPYATLDETKAVLQSAQEEWGRELPERYEFAICLKGSHIGGITLYMQDDRTEAEFGWVLHKDYWRQGYAVEAALAMMDFAKSIGVRRIFACCDKDNVASYKTMEKLGMVCIKDDGVRTNRSTGDTPHVELTYEIRW